MLRQGPLQGVAEGLHRALQVPQPQGFLHHRQHRGAVERRRAIGRLLGIELQLQIEEAPQPLVAAAAAEGQQVGHGGGGEQTTGQIRRPQGAQQLAQIPPGTGRQHRIPRREGPVGPVHGVAQGPEPLAAGKLPPPFVLPAGRITPDPHRLAAIGQIHHAARIQRHRRRWCHPQMTKQPRVDAGGSAVPLLQPGHLGGAHIEDVGAAPEGARAAAALVVRLQQLHSQAFLRQQRRRRQTGDAGPHHHRIHPAGFAW